MTNKRTLAIDFGLKRIGLAVSDPLKIIATPLDNIIASYSMQETAKLILKKMEEKKYQIDEIVIGLPLHMKGTESEGSLQVKKFKEILSEVFIGISIHLLDERLTSVQAERSLMEGHMNRKNRAKVVDRLSAVIILQTFLEKNRI